MYWFCTGQDISGQSVLNCQYANVWGSYKVWIVWVIQCESYLFHMAFVNSIIVHSIFEKFIIWFVELIANIGISTNRMIFFGVFCHEARRFLMKISSRISFELDQLCLREIDWNRMATNNKQSKYWSTMKQEPKRLLKNKILNFIKFNEGRYLRTSSEQDRTVHGYLRTGQTNKK